MTKDTFEHISGPVGRIMEKVETPRIAAIATKYAGVQFRSRLEARWAAYFDLRGLKWDYEPIDFDGWIPDFRLQPVVAERAIDVFAEIKPVFDPEATDAGYEKATKYSSAMWILLLGAAPMDWQIGRLLGPESDETELSALNGTLSGYDVATWEYADHRPVWNEAGNRVQWKAPEVRW